MTAPAPLDLPALLDDLERAHAAATPGPWQVAPSGGIDAGDYDTVIGRGDVNCMAHCYGGTSTIEGDNLAADAAAIVAAVNAVPTLIAALRAVLDVHGAIDAVQYLSARQIPRRVCTGCGSDDGNWQAWPCPTVRALAAHLAPATPPAEESQP